MSTLLWILAVILVLIFVYSVLPNLIVRWLHLGAVRKGPQRNEVALTFDDGPHPVWTPQLLDELQKAGIRATFFVLAQNALAHRDIVARMIQEGHEVEVHGFRHWFVPWLLPRETERQVTEAASSITAASGVATRYYRPTWGMCNLWTFLSGATRTHRLVTWSVMVGDWRISSAQTLKERILDKLHPGAIIVLHDAETFGAKLGAPQQVIHLIRGLSDDVRSRGYEFVRLCDWDGQMAVPD